MGKANLVWLAPVFIVIILRDSCVARSPTAQDPFVQHLRAGTEEANQGNFSSAMADLQTAVELDRDNAEAWYQLGSLLGQMTDFRGAESAFRRAIKLKPEFAQAHYSLGLALTANPKSKLDWPGAISEFREALKYKPDYAEAFNLLGAGLTSTGEVDAAIPQLQHAIQIKPAFSAAHFNLAIALEKNDRLKGAAEEYRLAVSTRGAYPEATSALGKLLLRMGETTEARQELENALRLNPDLGDAHYALARALQSLGQNDDALIEFDEAKDLAQREPDAMQSALFSNTALELAAKGDFTGAAASLRRAIALEPDYGIPHHNLGLILADQGEMNEAAQELTKAISLMPGRARPWFDLGRVRKLQSDRRGAFEALSWAARLSPSDASIRSELASLPGTNPSSQATEPLPASQPMNQPKLGAVFDTARDHVAFAAELSARGDFLGAVGELLRALALQPAQIDARLALGRAYERLGDRDRTILEYGKIVRLVPEDAQVRIALGEVLLKSGRAREAANQFRIVLAHQPGSPEARAALKRATRALATPASANR
jgi:tetratricopeptide (TPR) repeat protein